MVTGSLSPAGGGAIESLTPVSYTTQFYEQLPFYLSIGVTWDEFWNDDCLKVKYYRKAYKITKKKENQKLWMLGAYFYEALCDVAPVIHAFAKKGTKPLPYPSEPFALDKKEAEENKRANEEAKVRRFKDKMTAWAAKNNAVRKPAPKEVT